jgi:hypothetical protein
VVIATLRIAGKAETVIKGKPRYGLTLEATDGNTVFMSVVKVPRAIYDSLQLGDPIDLVIRKRKEIQL